MSIMDQEEKFVCWCQFKCKVDEASIKMHLRNCVQYQSKSEFFRAFSLLNTHVLGPPQLLAIKAEFSLMAERMDEILRAKMPPIKATQSSPMMQIEKPQQQQIPSYIMPFKTEKCIICKKQVDEKYIVYSECCFQQFCRECITKFLSNYVQQNGKLNCPNCGSLFIDYYIEQILGKERKDQFDNQLLMKQLNIVQCIKCQQQGAFEVGNQKNLVLKDPTNNQPLNQNYVQHYNENRFTCGNNQCKTEQCKSCHSSPYHLGYTCQEFEKKQLSKRCRYCDNTIHQVDLQKPLALQDICNQGDCVEKTKFACQKTLNCGHSCGGFINEPKCLGCLNETCASKLKDVKGDDYCNICFVEGLSQSPSIQSICGHVFHYACILKRLEVKWNGPRIYFSFCFCPLCKQWLIFEPSKAQDMLIYYLELYKEVQFKALERLKYEGRDKDERLNKVGDNFYQKQQEYSMAIYCYYMCFKCKKPYFGGAKDCNRAMENEKMEFKPEELVCANCCDVEKVENCNKHGKDYIEFKCKFCCSLAVWFCWGTTHFCEDCHKRQCNGDYVSKYEKNKLPQCGGKQKCPLQVDHKPNGEEQSLGCGIQLNYQQALCRNEKANSKAY